MSFLSTPKPFLETNAWQHSNLNSLRYNTSQAGSVLPMGWGTFRQQINLIGFGDYRGPSGKKGKTGPLPTRGTHAGKGGGAGSKKGVGGKKNSSYSVDVDFAICQGPVDIGNKNKVWASAGVAFFQSVGLNLYTGEDEQTADPVFVSLGQVVGYSGTCHVTGTPMDLGSSPVLPNLSFEVTGFEVGTVGDSYPYDANPANVISDFLTNIRYGAGWPSASLDPDLDTTYGDYCQAAGLAISPVLQVQTEAASWVSELARLTNTAIVWSGTTLKFIPYGDIALNNFGATWTPNLTPLYSLTDDDFLPWNPHIDSHEPQLGEEDPIIITRSNPHDVTNWVSIEYLDRSNHYDKTVLAQFDQGSIDLYGLRTASSIQGNCFCHTMPAETSARLILQRSLYVRNIYKFQLGWRHALLEPMDIVLLTDSRCGLDEQPVRITAIEENDNGDLVVDAEEIVVGTTSPALPANPDGSIYLNHNFLIADPMPAWATDSPEGTLSVWIMPDQDVGAQGLLSTLFHRTLGIAYDTSDGSVGFYFAAADGSFWQGQTPPDVIVTDGKWHHFACSWNTLVWPLEPVDFFYDGVRIPVSQVNRSGAGFDVWYRTDDLIAFCTEGGLISLTNGAFVGGMQDYYFLHGTRINLLSSANLLKFRTMGGKAVRLGDDASSPTGSPPTVFLHCDYHANLVDLVNDFPVNQGSGGSLSTLLGPFLPHGITSTPYE